MLNIKDILNILPHGYPFLLVDYVEYLDENSIVAVKNVTYNENYFIGHFANNPIMPGVLILEALAQTSAILAAKVLNLVKKEEHDVLLTSISQAKFKKMVIPGDVLKLHSTIERTKGPLWQFNVFAQVDNFQVSQAIISAVLKKNSS
ncbi:MAG: 3-hydroxyacyl-ACP dehydratase FabZ [Rickettsia sp.]|nr:3-hydroxyacyl-ACP dehydratase FabZ [Rickettsia sp.]